MTTQVKTNLIADGAVTTAKIADGAVTSAKLAGTIASLGPKFEAYQSAAQTLGVATWEKVQLQSESFDSAACFDSTTNYRFTPNVAGYYWFSGRVAVSTMGAIVWLALYKNGVIAKRGSDSPSGDLGGSTLSAMVYLNGTTDYVELFVQADASRVVTTGAANTYFQGFLAAN